MKLSDCISPVTTQTYLVTASYQRTSCNIKKPHILGNLLPSIEFRRLNVAINLHVPFRWTHVLPKSNHINIRLPQLCKKCKEYEGKSSEYHVIHQPFNASRT